MSQAIDTTLERFVNHLVQGFTPELARHFAELPQPTAEFQVRLKELCQMMKLESTIPISSLWTLSR